MTKLREIKRGGCLPDRIATDILARVADGALKPGDALPTETALAGIFGVSRNVVREAIARLRSDGVIDTKQGRGAVVRRPSERKTFRIDAAALDKKNNLSDLFELRGVLEIEAAAIVARRRTAADIAELEASISEMENHGAVDEERLEADARFHRLLGAATKNAFLGTIIDYLSSRLKDTARATAEIYAMSDLLVVTAGEHRRILDAVRAGDPDAARAAMAAHLRSAAGRLGVPPRDDG